MKDKEKAKKKREERKERKGKERKRKKKKTTEKEKEIRRRTNPLSGKPSLPPLLEFQIHYFHVVIDPPLLNNGVRHGGDNLSLPLLLVFLYDTCKVALFILFLYASGSVTCIRCH